MPNRTFPPGGTVYHTRRDQVQLTIVDGTEPGWVTLMLTDRSPGSGPDPLIGLDEQQVLGLYHRLGDWLVQQAGLTTG